jgi:diadenylate cyclase
LQGLFMEKFLTMLHNSLAIMRWQDIIDIILVAFILYRIIKLLRDSSAGQVLKGIIVIIIATQVVGWLQLNVLYYLLSGALQIGILALVILFQPELRRMLDSVGRSRLPTLFNQDREFNENTITRSITLLVESSVYFSRTKTGALISIERDTKLGDIMKTGTMINADISVELLKNIFYNKAPLHDGAVIIRDGKIAAAGCVLPLSENKNLSRELGTRHRAGVGLSEKSDAIVIIVSEETGAISVASGGLLKRYLSQEMLSALLTKELIIEKQEEKKLKKFMFWKKKR